MNISRRQVGPVTSRNLTRSSNSAEDFTRILAVARLAAQWRSDADDVAGLDELRENARQFSGLLEMT